MSTLYMFFGRGFGLGDKQIDTQSKGLGKIEGPSHGSGWGVGCSLIVC